MSSSVISTVRHHFSLGPSSAVRLSRFALLVLLLLPGHAGATDQGVTGKKLLIKSGKFVLLSKDPSISIAGTAINSESSVLIVDNSVDPFVSVVLPESFWTTNGSGTVLKFKTPVESIIKIVKVKQGLIKVVGRESFVGVPNGPATIHVTLGLANDSNKYCLTFTGTGDGNKFLVKDAAAGSCPIVSVCGNDTKEGAEVCDGTDSASCPGICQGDCTCPVCGDNATEGAEECDGFDDAACPGLCQGDCTCDLSGPACCQGSGECSGTPVAGICQIFGATPVGGGTVCGASGMCESALSPGGCCEVNVPPQVCAMPFNSADCLAAGGVYHADTICHTDGSCAAPAPCNTTSFLLCQIILGGGSFSCNSCCANDANCDVACSNAVLGGCLSSASNDACKAAVQLAGCADECCLL